MIITICDFDDTIYPTSHQGLHGINSYLEIDKIISNMIQAITDVSDVFLIITNAESGWVDLCLMNLPISKKLLQDIEIISTRELLGDAKPQGNLWKSYAFDLIIRKYIIEGGKHHLLSFGDSYWDRDAALSISKKYTNVCVKNVKFFDIPTLEELIRQQELITNRIKSIQEHQTMLDLKLIKYQRDQAPSSTISHSTQSSELESS